MWGKLLHSTRAKGLEGSFPRVMLDYVFVPPQEILAKYADLLVSFALSGGRGISQGDVVQLVIPEVAKPLYKELLRAVLSKGGFPKLLFLPSETDSIFFSYATQEQRTFFPAAYKRAEADLLHHQVSIIADANPRELSAIDPAKIFETMDARRPFRDWLHQKEERNEFSWTLALYGTEAMAKEASLSIEEYWEQIIRACFLDAKDPIGEWKGVQAEQERVKKALNALEIEWLHVESKAIDLHVQLGKYRQWLGGSCRNIPSFEIFISPDWRGTKGTISFNQPLYRYGNLLKGITLAFKDGLVNEARAEVGQAVLDGMLSRSNARKIGEYSLTDKRFSRITKFMANTLFDENMGGEFGNTHLALGRAYKDSYPGPMHEVSEQEWENLGYNDSPEHTDIISTEDRTVTATLPNKSKVVIFKDGMFTV